MAIQDDFEVQVDGDIRHIGANTAHYTVIELHRWLGNLMDDAQASGDDFLDITDATASERATDNLITLKAPFNIDDTTAQYFYDGSIVQTNGDVIYDGIVVIAAAGMYLQVIQNGALATNFWTTAWNADATNGISHRFMLKVRTAGADIDGRRLVGTTREWGKTYSEFKINGTSRGNNVMALGYADDLNNTTLVGTVAGWTGITNTTEGYKTLDVDQDTVNEAYYSEWNTTKPTLTINQFYERMKWLTRRGTTETLYGLDGDLFRGITHELALTTPRSGTWGTPEHEPLTWTGGTGRLLAIDNKAGASSTKMWIQVLTGVAPTTGLVVTGTTSTASATTTGSATEKSLSFPFCGASTGSAIIGSYGFGIEAADLTNLDKVFDLLTGGAITPPNQVQFAVGGLNSTASPYDRVLVGPLGYTVQYSGETGGPYVRGETLTFSVGATGTAYLSELLDLGTTGFLTFRMLTGDPPVNGSTIAGAGGASGTAVGAAVAAEDYRQLKLATTLVGATETAVVCTAAIPTDTPKPTGTIRIQLNTGIYRRVAYTSYTGSTFTIAPTDFSGANTATGGAVEAGNSIFVSYIDKNATTASESFTSVYLANRGVFVRVRFGDPAAPIKTFETSGLLTGAGGSATAIRTTDA